MNVSNAIPTVLTTPAVVRPNGVAGTSKPASSGDVLPEARQVRVQTENRQDAGVVPGQSDLVRSSPDTTELHALVDQANATLQGRFSDLKFTVVEGTEINVVRVEDTETGELIRQIPSETMVAIARALDEAQKGMMLETEV